MHILDKIVAYKKQEIEATSLRNPIAELENAPLFQRDCNSYSRLLDDLTSSGVIAEYKRKSPSRSDINLTANVLDVGRGYKVGGASAISVLTDEYYFGGSPNYLRQLREELPDTPLLRKDFVISEYQILEAKAIGADIILLICEILTKEEIQKYSQLARSLGMEILLEMHSADQVVKYNEAISIVGVNNRDLKTFEVDFDRSKNLFDQLPSEVPKIAESGLRDPETCHMLYEYGFRGFLIGEQFMKQEDPGSSCRQFVSELLALRGVDIKTSE